jgi:hypothetical protein
MGDLPSKGQADCKGIIMCCCPMCRTVQKLGSTCGICNAPLYPPYLIEVDGKLVVRTYKEMEKDG